MKKGIFILLFLSYKILFAQSDYNEEGLASFYANKFHGRKTASGQKYLKNKYTAAHKSLPFNTKIKVTNLSNDKTVIVTINDRGPFSKGKIIDLSYCAAKDLDFITNGVTKVKLEILNDSTNISENLTLADTLESKESIDILVPQTPGKVYDYNLKETELDGYYIQTGSYKEQEALSSQINILKEKVDANNIYIEVIKIKSTIINRILLGPYDKVKGNSELAALQKKGISGFLKNY